MTVALIPARGGSKRIPCKNMKLFSGRPIIEYSIKSALQSGLFDRVLVSTDSEEIARISTLAGAEVPFSRPVALADDFAPTQAVVRHALETLAKDGQEPEYICCIYATAPFLRSDDLRKGYDLLRSNGAPAAISVTTFDFPIYRGLKITEKGSIEFIWPEHELTRSNDLPMAYHDAAQFYWLSTEAFKRHGKIWIPGALPVVLPRYLVHDIDTLEDWETAERMYRANQEMKND